MANAANALVLKVGTSATPTVDFEGIKKATITLDRTELDVTDFAGGAFRQRILGLKDFPCSLSGDFEPADASYGVIKTAYGDGSTVYVRILPNGTAGFEAGYKVKSIAFDNDVDGLATVSIELVSTTDVTLV